MITFNASKEYITISYVKENQIVPVNEWTDDVESSLCAGLLSDFIDNGFASTQENGINLSYDAIYSLSTYERKALSLPELYPYTLYIQPKGQLKDNTFTYNVSYRASKMGERFHVRREGGIIFTAKDCFILNKEQYELIEAIDEYNAIPQSEKTFNNNLIQFSRLKRLSQKARVILDKYLDNENVYIPSKLKIEIEKIGEDCFEVVPCLNAQDADCEPSIVNDFSRYLETRTEVPDNVAISTANNGRVRVVLDQDKKELVEKLRKEYSRVPSKRLKELVENPSLFLDAEQCELNVFYSDRVIEIGLYKPKVYPFVSPYKSEWISPTYTVEDRVNGVSKIEFHQLEEVELFENKIRLAEINGLSCIEHQQTLINIDDARFMAQDARDRFAKRDKEKKEKEVLIIEENAETLGYTVEIDNKENKKDYKFEEIPGLRKEIQLKEHQKEGIAWLQGLVRGKEKGSLLADDMGLGKTLQILSFIDWYDKNYFSSKPYLIVAPVSLLENWEEEYKKFFASPRIPMQVVSGPNVSRRFTKGIDQRMITYLQNHQIILTNYETIRSFQLSFGAVDYSIVVLDEAQKIKTPGNLITNAAKAIKADFKVAMTGTPVENTLVDLWCIMDFALPGLLGNCKEFRTRYQEPLKSIDNDIESMGTHIREAMGQYFLRRLKMDVAKDLPKKNIRYIECEMSEPQKSQYQSIVDNAIAERDSSKPKTGYMLTCLQQLKSISDHPAQGGDYLSMPIAEIVSSSAKMKALLQILTEIKSRNEKVIIFADRRDMQQILKRVVRHYYQIDCHIINGETPTTKSNCFHQGKETRLQAVQDFQRRNGFNVIIMSPIAAGMGLNVVGANHVVHYSRHWNPAKENQATDRVYRIGQDKEVFVYYPIATYPGIKSFDENLDELLKRKSQLADATLFPSARIEISCEELFNSVIG